MHAVIRVQRDTDLMLVVAATGLPGRLASELDRRQQQCDQDPDHGDHHQQLHERETTLAFSVWAHESSPTCEHDTTDSRTK